MGSGAPAGVGSVFPARAPCQWDAGRSGDGKSPRGEVIRDGVFADVVKADSRPARLAVGEGVVAA